MAKLDKLRDPVHLFFQPCHPPEFNLVLYLLAMQIVVDLLCPCAACSSWPHAWLTGTLDDSTCSCPYAQPVKDGNVPCIKCSQQKWVYFQLPRINSRVADQFSLNSVDWSKLHRDASKPLVNAHGKPVCALSCSSSTHALGNIVKDLARGLLHTPPGAASPEPVFAPNDKLPTPHRFRDFMRTFLAKTLASKGEAAAETCAKVAGHTVKKQGQVCRHALLGPRSCPCSMHHSPRLHVF